MSRPRGYNRSRLGQRAPQLSARTSAQSLDHLAGRRSLDGLAAFRLLDRALEDTRHGEVPLGHALPFAQAPHLLAVLR